MAIQADHPAPIHLFYSARRSRMVLSWIRRALWGKPCPPINRKRFQPFLEALEDRVTPANYTVTGLTDANSNGGGAGAALAGDLRYCITHANGQLNEQNTITFANTLAGKLSLQAVLPELLGKINIVGVERDDTKITVSRGVEAEFRIFKVDAKATVEISYLTITNGDKWCQFIFSLDDHAFAPVLSHPCHACHDLSLTICSTMP
jgi:hypothetical protein